MSKTSTKQQVGAEKPSYFRRYVWTMWLLLLAGFAVFAIILFFISMTNLPDPQQLENPKFEYATKIYTVDQEELGRFFRKNRDWVYHEDLSPHLVNALVATEDERYYRHSGIDTRGTLRAVAYMGKKGGASTISQQLSKLLFTNRSTNFIKRVFQKFREWIIAVRIEKRYTKEEIIAMYLNKFDFIYDSDGVAAAAQTYFGKNQKDLNVQEAAMLIGMLKNPYIFNPKRAPERAKLRRMVVLNQMRKNDFITKAEYDSLKVLDLDMQNFRRLEDSKGLAPHFRSELTKYVKDILNDEERLKPDGTPYNIYTDGLKIYTTIDSKMQKYAEDAVRKNMKNLQERYWERWEGKDPWTYDADEAQAEIRKNSLNSLIRQSPRYQMIKDRYMSKVFMDIESSIQGVRLLDFDMIRMITEDKKSGYLVSLINRKVVTKSQVAVYREILKSSYWPEAKKQWTLMENEVREKFNKKIKMKVFAYNSAGEKDTIMTPLDSIKYHRMHMQSGMMSIEPSTGYVRTWVGGVDHSYFQYDHVNSNRQVGSTFKPFIYGTAIFQQGMSPCWKVQDIQYSIPAHDKNFGLMKTWSPSNANGKFSGESLTLYEGLKQSKNSVSVFLMKELGNVEVVRDLSSNMGIPIEKIPSSPSICLGTPELSLYDMTSAYSTFANNGLYNKPIFVTRIEDKDGRVIYNETPDQRKALPEDYNFVMVDMLKYAATPIANKIQSEVGGKTGTTNDYVDGWFMGITPNLVVGTWVGGEDPWIRFRSLADGQGGVMARPTFIYFMQDLENDPSVKFDKTAQFKVPNKMDIETNCDVYESIRNAGLPNNNSGNSDDLFDEG